MIKGVSGGRNTFWHWLVRESIVRGFEGEIKCKDGSRKWISETACKVTTLDAALLYYQGFIVDITAQKKAQKERDLMEVNLRQAQTLESVGHLAAGIAHEINTPIQYVGDSRRFITESFGGLNGLLAHNAGIWRRQCRRTVFRRKCLRLLNHPAPRLILNI